MALVVAIAGMMLPAISGRVSNGRNDYTGETLAFDVKLGFAVDAERGASQVRRGCNEVQHVFIVLVKGEMCPIWRCWLSFLVAFAEILDAAG